MELGSRSDSGLCLSRKQVGARRLVAGARFRYPILRVVVGLDGVLDALSAKRERAIWRSGRTRDALEL